MDSEIDPIRLEVVKNALLAITDEMSAALQRSAYSTNIKTRGDFSCAMFDTDLRVVGQSFSQPTHLGSLVHSAPRLVAEYGAGNMRHGDGVLMNDAHRGAVHLNDISLVSPVDVGGRRIGYVANVAHHVDVGGSTPGSLGLNREIFQEGLILPPVQLVAGGVIDDDIIRLIAANIRSPRESLGDFRAQVAANQLASRRLVALAEEMGTDELGRYMSALLNYTQRRVAREIAELPAGEYHAVDFLDDDGFGDTPVKIDVLVRIGDGGIEFDLTGCDAQGTGPMNATASMAYSGVAYVLKALLDTDIPVNDGFYRMCKVRSTAGSVVNASHPAAVAGGWEVCFRVAETAFAALADAFPDRIPAATKGIICNVSFGGVDPRTGDYYAFYETIAGGYGAHSHMDGMDGVQSHIHNTENAPVEEIELNYPVRIAQFSLIPDSGGGGEFRGGLGVRRDYWFVDHDATFSVVSDRTKFAPAGVAGGQPGRPAHFVVDPDGVGRELRSKATIRVPAGGIVSVQTPGGGGYGDPARRDGEAALADLRTGKVSTADTVGPDTDGRIS
ncbi:hydantoinase B/oxoprolinase family protein [Phytohabitans suffuscus]|uniref:N-methylhydantoinase B n=1 Tax=Phytohabitans suffuscus TaxID=624315 RepID=A0A6F8YEZ3_9ACTN|nr:hydantoinase B/oxoprolinase family protein [Phytohabitans suffuscus]BCB84521.1 N-methylhydantoinase B [Phytohabitans suffuscus]